MLLGSLAFVAVLFLIVATTPATAVDGTDDFDNTTQSQETEAVVGLAGTSATGLTIHADESDEIRRTVAGELSVPDGVVQVHPGTGNATVEIRRSVALEDFERALQAADIRTDEGHLRPRPTDATIETTGELLLTRFGIARDAPTTLERSRFDDGTAGFWLLASDSRESWVTRLTRTRGEFELVFQTAAGERRHVLNRTAVDTVGPRQTEAGTQVVPVTLTASGADALVETVRAHDPPGARDCEPLASTSNPGTDGCFVVEIDGERGPTFGSPQEFDSEESRQLSIPTANATEAIWIETTLAVDPLPVPVTAEIRTGDDILGIPPDETLADPWPPNQNVGVDPPPSDDTITVESPSQGNGTQSGGDGGTDAEAYEPPPLPEESADIDAADDAGSGFTAVSALVAITVAAFPVLRRSNGRRFKKRGD